MAAYMRDATGHRLDTFAVSSTFGERLRRAAARASGNNSIELPVISSPPAIAAFSSNSPAIDATLTNTYRVTAGQAGAFKTRGGSPFVQSTSYWRFPVVTLPSGTGNATPTQDAKGWAVEFISDAPKLLLDLLGSSSPIGIQVEVDGQRIAATSTSFASPATAERWFTLDFSGVSQLRRYRLEGRDSAGFRGVAVAPIYKVWAPGPSDEILAAVAGDSITAQQGSGLPNGGFAITLGKLLGWTDVREVGIGGTGYINPGTSSSNIGDPSRVADVSAIAPDILVLPASSNDAASASASITAAMLAGYRAYRAALPNVPIVCSGVWGGATGPVAGWLAVEAAAKAAFDAWADPNSWWIPVSNDPNGAWVTGTGHSGATNGSGNSDLYVNAADTTHPNDAGHTYYARRFATAMRQIVLPNIR